MCCCAYVVLTERSLLVPSVKNPDTRHASHRTLCHQGTRHRQGSTAPIAGQTGTWPAHTQLKSRPLSSEITPRHRETITSLCSTRRLYFCLRLLPSMSPCNTRHWAGIGRWRADTPVKVLAPRPVRQQDPKKRAKIVTRTGQYRKQHTASWTPPLPC